MKFFVTERLGPNRSLTPEGFLLCKDVPIARTGVMDYLEEELPGVEGDRGVIRVQRNEEEVFSAEALASFAGKPVVNDHPDDDVTPATWRQLAIGTILNPRRGEGNQADLVLADLLITDQDGIEAIEAGKVEVSNGYDAEYEQIKPGLARQHKIIGNHVALVEAGRCGPRCSIGDHAISVTLERQNAMPKLSTKKSFKDRLLAAFKAKDEAAIEKLAGEVTDEEPIAENDLTGTSGQHIHVHLNSGTGGDASTKDEGEGGEGDRDDPFKKVTDALGEVTKCMKDMGERITKLEGGGSATNDAEGDDDDDDDTSTNDADGDDDDKGGKTKDSSGLVNAFKDVIARAEILVPGIKVPTLDKKADPKKTLDAICGFRRKALDKAYATEDGKAVIDAITGSTSLKTKDMTCDAAKLLFNAASEATKAANRASTTGSSRFHDGDIGTKKPMTIADINSKATDFWKPKA